MTLTTFVESPAYLMSEICKRQIFGWSGEIPHLVIQIQWGFLTVGALLESCLIPMVTLSREMLAECVGTA